MLQDIFFIMPKGKEFEILRECKDLSFAVFIDKIGPNGRTREPHDISFDECLQYFKDNLKNMHWVFINRRGKCMWDVVNEPEYWEVGGCTLGKNPEVFLFINMRFSEGIDMQRKYNLKPL